MVCFPDADIIYCDSSLEEYIGDIPSNIQYLHLPNKKFDDLVQNARTVVDQKARTKLYEQAQIIFSRIKINNIMRR